MENIGEFIEQLSRADRIMAHAVQQIGFESLQAMVEHLSGKQITWKGGQFSINVGTGNLRRMSRMEYPLLGNPLAVAVFNRARYADAVERGRTGREMVDSLLRNASISKTGKRYRVVPMDDGFVTVTEKSLWRDIPPRPFSEAAFESMEERIERILEDAIRQVIEG